MNTYLEYAAIEENKLTEERKIHYTYYRQARSYVQTVEENVVILRKLLAKGYDVLEYRITRDNENWNAALRIVWDEIDLDTYAPIHKKRIL